MSNANYIAIDQPVSSLETGKLGIRHLKRFWYKCLLKRANKPASNDFEDEWQLDKTLLSALQLGLEPTLVYIYQLGPSFEQLEDWVIDTAGIPVAQNVARFNSIFDTSAQHSAPEVENGLSGEQLRFWDTNGYLIIKNAVPKEDCEKTIEAICNFIQVDSNNPETWYASHPARQGIMVQLFQHPVLDSNRQSAKIRIAYEQLWKRKDVWVTTDRVSFNPPETATWKFPGPAMHWDCSLELPIPFGLQGLLYLADTEPEQGAFTLVPGFHHQIESWLHALPQGADPRNEDLHALGSKPIAAEAGDFIIWHQALPHGSRPNHSTKPRFVQYITYGPADAEKAAKWK